jgi:hypothetical protein
MKRRHRTSRQESRPKGITNLQDTNLSINNKIRYQYLFINHYYYVMLCYAMVFCCCCCVAHISMFGRKITPSTCRHRHRRRDDIEYELLNI